MILRDPATYASTRLSRTHAITHPMATTRPTSYNPAATTHNQQALAHPTPGA